MYLFNVCLVFNDRLYVHIFTDDDNNKQNNVMTNRKIQETLEANVM